jgi:hypothetical protein
LSSLTLGTNIVAGDPYLNTTLFATAEVVSTIISQYVLDKYGRKIPYIANMLIAAFVLIGIYFVPKCNSFLPDRGVYAFSRLAYGLDKDYFFSS